MKASASEFIRTVVPVLLLTGVLPASTIDARDEVDPRRDFVTVEPDDFAVGTDISTLTPGVILSAFGSQPDFGFPLLSDKIRVRIPRDPDAPVPTGSFVFGVDSDDFEGSFFAGGHLFRADFSNLTDFVSIRVAPDNPDVEDIALLQIFGGGGVLLDEFTTLGGPTEVIFSRPTPDIAFLIATNPAGNEGDSFMLDQLIFRTATPTEIPEPSSVTLVIGGLSVLAARKQRKSGASTVVGRHFPMPSNDGSAG